MVKKYYKTIDRKLFSKSILLGGFLAFGVTNAQTGKVGINTESPKETLEIQGTLRVDNLPKSETGKIYNGADVANTTFTGVNTVVSDANGNIGYLPMLPIFTAIKGVDGQDAYQDVNVNVNSSINRNITQQMATTTFTLDKKSLVIFNVTMSISIDSILTLPTKRLGVDVRLTGGSFSNTSIINNGIPFNTGIENRGFVGGIYTVGGNRAIILDRGTYTTTVNGRVTINTQDTTSFTMRMGSSAADTFDIIAYPVIE